MIELQRNSLVPHSKAQSDLRGLEQRASQQRYKYRRGINALPLPTAAQLLSSSAQYLSRLPHRYLLHVVITLTVPLALVLGQVSFRTSDMHQSPTAVPSLMLSDTLALAPISLDQQSSYQAPLGLSVGDPPLEWDESLPMPISLSGNPELLGPPVVPGSISGDVVRLRGGPGREYDELGRISGGSPIQIIGRFGEWLQIRESVNKPSFWVAAELVDVAEAAISIVPDVPQALIPVAPPAKVGTVIEEKLNLRDGPGTNYISLLQLASGQSVDLIQQYQDWLYVSAGEQSGWLKSEFLTIGENILARVPVAQTIPDANPALVGVINENKVNLRGGPGSVYAKSGTVDAGQEVSLLARHKDWYKVQLSNGTKAWIFSDLLRVPPMVNRRVPVTNNIPAPPTVRRTTTSRGGNPVNIPASGDVASFAVQFVGYRYAWGGTSPSRGFDCSGFVRYVYSQYGISLPHSSGGQYSSAYGSFVGSINNLAPGDLVFFVRTGGRGITHVGIYIGGGRMVHAMAPGLGVQVSSLWSDYWLGHYYGALRVNR